MTIKDTDIFAPPAGAGMAKKYIAGMAAEYLDAIRSAVDGKVYIRLSTTPVSLAVTTDPALDANNFAIDDPSTQVGTIKAMPVTTTPEKPMTWINGQAWLRGNNLADVEQLPRAVPPSLVSLFGGVNSITHMTGLANGAHYTSSAATDDKGTWVLTSARGNGATADAALYKSTDDGRTWSPMAAPVNPSYYIGQRITTDKNGRWWYHSGTATSPNLWFTDNLGASWTPIDNPAGAGTCNILKFAYGTLYIVPYQTRNYTNASAGAVRAFYRCTAPYAASPVWTAMDFDRLLPYNAGHNDISWTTIVTNVEPLPNGSFWIAGISNSGDYSIPPLVMYYDQPTNVWTCMPWGSLWSRNTPSINARATFMIGASLDGENLRVMGTSSGRVEFFDFIYRKTGEVDIYKIFAMDTVDNSVSGNSSAWVWSQILPNLLPGRFYCDGTHRFLYMYGQASVGGGIQNVTISAFHNGRRYLRPVSTQGVYPMTLDRNTNVMVFRSGNGTVLYFPGTWGFQPTFGRTRGVIGLPLDQAYGVNFTTPLAATQASVADYMRVQ